MPGRSLSLEDKNIIRGWVETVPLIYLLAKETDAFLSIGCPRNPPSSLGLTSASEYHQDSS